MNRQQVLHVFDRLRPTPSSVVLPSVTILLANGKQIDGDAQTPSTNDLMQVSMPRVADAHIAKGPMTVYVDINAIAAITSNIVAVPLLATAEEPHASNAEDRVPVTVTAGKTAEPV
jgi:hypothetical protein